MSSSTSEELWRQLEQAGSALQGGSSTDRAAAEQWLSQLRQSRLPLSLAPFVLAHGGASSFARFQAVAALQEAVLREWRNIDSGTVSALAAAALQFARRNGEADPLAQRVSLRFVAAVRKRSWRQSPRDPAEEMRAEFSTLSEINPKASLVLATALLEEFAVVQRGFAGLSLEVQFSIRRDFEDRVLRAIFERVCQLVAVADCVEIAVAVLEKALHWKFDEFIAKRRLEFLCGDSALESLDEPWTNGTWIRPGTNWRSLLLDPQILNLVEFATKHSRKAAQSARNIFAQLCSLQGTIYKDEGMREAHLEQLALFLQRLVHQMHVQTSDDAFVMDICNVYGKIVSNFGIALLNRCSSGLAFVQILGSLTVSLFQQSFSAADVETTLSEAFDVSVDAIVSILTQYEEERFKVAPEFFSLMKQISGAVFPGFVQFKMCKSPESIEEDEDQFHDAEYLSDRLTAIAIIGRVNGTQSIEILCSAIKKRMELIRNAVFTQTAISEQQLSFAHEDLYWLINLLGHLLADSPEGEVPTVPWLLRFGESQDSACTQSSLLQHPWYYAIATVIDYIKFENECIANKHRAILFLSPLVAETIMAFLERWVPTYLFPSIAVYDQIPMALYHLFGPESSNSLEILRFVLSKISINLFHWSEEWNLSLASCKLLNRLVMNQNLKNKLVGLSEWWELVRICTDFSHSPLWTSISLPGEVVTDLFKTLGSSLSLDSQSHSEESSVQLWTTISTSISTRFDQLLNGVAFHQQQLSPQFESEVTKTIEIFRGLANAQVNEATANVFFDFLISKAQIFLELLRTYQNTPVVNVILSFFSEFAGANLIYWDSERSNHFFRVCVDLIRVFSEINRNRLKTSIGQDQYEDVLILLTLIDHISTKTLFDFASDGGESYSTEAALMAVSMLLPQLDENMLNVSELCTALFAIIEDLITSYPEKLFITLDTAAQERLFAGMDYLLNSAVQTSVHSGLHMLTALASHHYNSASSTSRNQFSSRIPAYQNRLLQMMLVDKINSETLDPLADALLSITLYNSENMKALMSSIVDSYQDFGTRKSLGDAFSLLDPYPPVNIPGNSSKNSKCLSSSGGLNGRANRVRFRALVRQCVEIARSSIQMN